MMLLMVSMVTMLVIGDVNDVVGDVNGDSNFNDDGKQQIIRGEGGVIIEAKTEILSLGLCARSSVVVLINKLLEILAPRFFSVSIILQRAKYDDHHHETIYDWDTKEEMADFISESRANLVV